MSRHSSITNSQPFKSETTSISTNQISLTQKHTWKNRKHRHQRLKTSCPRADNRSQSPKPQSHKVDFLCDRNFEGKKMVIRTANSRPRLPDAMILASHPLRTRRTHPTASSVAGKSSSSSFSSYRNARAILLKMPRPPSSVGQRNTRLDNNYRCIVSPLTRINRSDLYAIGNRKRILAFVF